MAPPPNYPTDQDQAIQIDDGKPGSARFLLDDAQIKARGVAPPNDVRPSRTSPWSQTSQLINTPSSKYLTGGQDRQKPSIASGSKSACIHTLTQSLYSFLDNGEVHKARRIFGLLLQLQGHRSHLGMHKDDIWAVGLELLTRGPKSHVPASTPTQISEVSAFIKSMIRKHPYVGKRPNALSALHFATMLYSHQIHNTHSTYVSALQALRQREPDDTPDQTPDATDELELDQDQHDIHGSKALAEERTLTTTAITDMGTIAENMDIQLQEEPYSKDPALISLRGMLSLCLVDILKLQAALLRDTAGSAVEQYHEIGREQRKAARVFRRVLQARGSVNRGILERLNMTDDPL